jgi:hypothetical protein
MSVSSVVMFLLRSLYIERYRFIFHIIVFMKIEGETILKTWKIIALRNWIFKGQISSSAAFIFRLRKILK